MLIIPAIDLREGRVVRLLKGRFEAETVYSVDPIGVARHWESCGAELIHVVDLDGALYGEPKNLHIVERIARGVNIPVQMGGGLRTKKAICDVLDSGASRAILGTKACEDKDFLRRSIEEFGERIIVSIDAKGGMVAKDGWRNISKIKAIDLAKELELLGLKLIIYTEITRNGTSMGPDAEKIQEVLKATNVPVIASGGISSLEDIKRLKRLGPEGLLGVIVGRALYEGKVDLRQAIESIS